MGGGGAGGSRDEDREIPHARHKLPNRFGMTRSGYEEIGECRYADLLKQRQPGLRTGGGCIFCGGGVNSLVAGAARKSRGVFRLFRHIKIKLWERPECVEETF